MSEENAKRVSSEKTVSEQSKVEIAKLNPMKSVAVPVMPTNRKNFTHDGASKPNSENEKSH